MNEKKLVPLDSTTREARAAKAARERRFRPVWIASAAAVALILSALVPSKRLGTEEQGAQQVIEEAPRIAQPRSVAQVIARYHLDAKLDSYLSLDKEGRIVFDSGPVPAAAGGGKDGRGRNGGAGDD